MVQIRWAEPGDLDRIVDFYLAREYSPGTRKNDRHVLAEEDGWIIGVVRLCEEGHSLILRGMQVAPEKQRQGIGLNMLSVLAEGIGSRECYCLPYRHLTDFYGKIGFLGIDPQEGPRFLQERLSRYLKSRPDFFMMRRSR